MLAINKSRLPAAEADVRAALAEYLAELEAHRLSVGVPAPWPKWDLLREILAAGGDLEVIDDSPPPRELALRALAAQEAEKQTAARAAQEDALLAKAALDPDAPPEVKAYMAGKVL